MSDWREYTCEYKWPNRPQLYKHLDLDWNLMCGKQNITDQEASNKTLTSYRCDLFLTLKYQIKVHILRFQGWVRLIEVGLGLVNEYAILRPFEVFEAIRGHLEGNHPTCTFIRYLRVKKCPTSIKEGEEGGGDVYLEKWPCFWKGFYSLSNEGDEGQQTTRVFYL